MTDAVEILRRRARIDADTGLEHPATIQDATADLLDTISRCLWGDPQPCDHTESGDKSGDCTQALADTSAALERAIERSEEHLAASVPS